MIKIKLTIKVHKFKKLKNLQQIPAINLDIKLKTRNIYLINIKFYIKKIYIYIYIYNILYLFIQILRR